MMAPAAFQRLQRRQARPSIRVAADMDSCAGRIARLPRPPHPPARKGPKASGTTKEGRGAGHSFSQCREPRIPLKTRGCAPVFWRNPHGSKARPCFGLVGNPRVDSFSPRVALFSPHGAFSLRGLFSSLLLLFLEERERREGARSGKWASTGLISCNKVCPQVGAHPHGFFVDEKAGESLAWRGFRGFQGGDPRPTERNAPVPPVVCVFGGAHGG